MAETPSILLVEDTASLAAVYTSYLKRSGYDSTQVMSGKEALYELDGGGYKVILLNLDLPDMDGTEILRMVQEQKLPVAVVIITAKSSVDVAVESMRLGAYDFLEKPFSADRLIVTVRNALKHMKNGSDAKDPRPYVFISYSSKDREKITYLKNYLEKEGIRCWWDQNIGVGDKWRQTITRKLSDATAVLTLWTENSVQSAPVIEEASNAQHDNKLIHAKLDRSPLPYGFSETQYTNILDWDGRDPYHPEILRLLQALKDKLNPPTQSELKKRLVEASPIAFQVRNGRVTAVDAPENVPPPIVHPEELDQRVVAQASLTEEILQDLESQGYNVPKEFSICVQRYHKVLSGHNSTQTNWFELDDKISGMRICMKRNSSENWNDDLRDRCDRLIKRHSEMEPLIRPKQIPLDQPDAPRPSPEPNLVHLEQDKQALEQLAKETQEASDILKSNETRTILDEVAIQALETSVSDITEGLKTEDYTENDKQMRHSLLRRGLIKTASVIGGLSLALTAGVSINLLTSPSAAATLINRLEHFLAIILKFF